MKRIALKNLPLTENDFESVNEYTERICGSEYNCSRYEISREALCLSETVTAKDIYRGDVKEKDGHCYVSIEHGRPLTPTIETLNRYYQLWQLRNAYCGTHSKEEAMAIRDAYPDFFAEWRAADTSDRNAVALASELGLTYAQMVFVSQHDDALYISSAYDLFTLPEEYGSIPVNIRIDAGDKVSFTVNAFLDESPTGIFLNECENRRDFQSQFEVLPPQRFTRGKCTAKKRAAWFSYIQAYYEAATEFCKNQTDAVNASIQKLTDAGFTACENPMKFQCVRNYFKCVATVERNGYIYSKISIENEQDVKRNLFGI